jgi:TctA family transporter
MTQQPALFWGIIASMWIGNFFLILLNLPLVGMWAKMLTIPYHLLFPGIMVFCAIGVFSLNNTSFDVYLMALFGALGYLFAKLKCEPAPMLLGFILGPMMEENLRRSLTLSRGDPLIFLRSPISVTMLIIALFALLLVLLPSFRETREEAFVEGD